MGKLIILRGLPASGKTTWAKEYQKKNSKTKRVNRDELRAMIDDSKWSKEKESHIKKLRNELINHYLKAGYDVISDDTNLSNKVLIDLRNLAIVNNCEFEIKDFRDVDLHTCIERDSLRDKPVGSKVIMRFHNQFIGNLNIIPKAKDETIKKNCIICDIDGTVAYMKNRSPYDYTKVGTDIPNTHLIELLSRLVDKDTQLFFFSGRKDDCSKMTKEWLDKYVKLDYTLVMRDSEDDRSDEIVKEEFYNDYIKGKYNVLAVFDDRPRCIRLWKKLGLFTCDVNRQDPRVDF